MLYYLGGLIQSLEMPASEIFLIQLIAFSLLELIALGLKHREIMLLGAIVIIVGSIGPVAYFIQEISTLAINMAVLGGALVAFSILFHILTFWVWFREK